ncbi:MAG TPA: hypothetical protein VJ949_06695 [Cryomorphaceae bacterium]|nr:hypothetical protein [Cryomorphaceae bacterium]
MKSLLFRLGIILLMGVIFLAVTNPSEEKFLHKVSADYGAIHGGMHFTPAQLLEMGSSQRQSWLIFSTYEYQFGTIGVRYVGFLFSVIHVESFREEKKSKSDEEGVIAHLNRLSQKSKFRQ